ncbi:MAG: ABC transporter substrate-binding protein [Janthinobacterium lividum]
MTEEQKTVSISSTEWETVAGALRHGVSRREMLRLLMGSGLAMGSGLTMISRATAAETAANAAATGTPKRGGKIRVAGLNSSTSDTLDPARAGYSTDHVRMNMFYSGLTQLDGKLNALPALATEIHNEGAVVWVFKLRSGVTFHDGRKLVPADVVYSLMRHKDPKVASKAKAVAEQIESVTASGPNEVTIKLTGANVDFPVIMATTQWKIIKDGTIDFTTANGTGPYKCAEFKPGVRSVSKRNDAYWKPGQPYLDEIEFIGIPDESARVNALLSGDVQLIMLNDARSAKHVTSTPGYQILETRGGLYTDFIIKQNVPPGSNRDFTLALKYMQNREQIRNVAYLGHAVIANDQPVDPTSRYYAAGLPQRPYDLDRARFHLKKSGLADQSFEAFASQAAQGSLDTGMLMQQSAQQIGMKLAINRVSPDGYWSNHWAKHPLSFGTINPVPTVDLLFTQFLRSTSPWNEASWNNPAFDQMLGAARGELNEAKRKQIYGDMQALVSNEGGLGIPVFIGVMDAYSSKLKGLGSIPVGGLMGYAFSEYVWLG